MRLLEGLDYRVGDAESSETIRVPAGFVTDFASIPWGLWNMFPPLGPWARAAIVHDYLYETGGLGGKYTRKEADQVFREAMAVVGVPAWQRSVMYRAVRLGGGSGWQG